MAYKWVCPATLFCAIFFVCLFCCCNTAKPRDGEKREAYIHRVSVEVYDTLLSLVQGKFEVLVSREEERTFTLDRKGCLRCILQEKRLSRSLWYQLPLEIPSNKQNLEAAKSYDIERPAVMRVKRRFFKLQTMNSNTEFTTLNSWTRRLPNQLRQNLSNHSTRSTWLTLSRILLNTTVKCISASCQ